MFSERIKGLTPYVPGEQPLDRKYIKLNTNENPYPPSPRVREFLKGYDIENLRLYPDPASNHLRQVIAEKSGIKKEEVFVSNGSDEALSFCFYAFFDSHKGKLLFPEFTYSFYPVYCSFYGIAHEKVPLDAGFSVDIEGFLKRRAGSCGLIIANPNAPTGIGLPPDQVRVLAENYSRDKVMIIDEAYVDFGGDTSLELIHEFNNLLIVRTFSKSLCLAGIRLGYVMGGRALIDALFTTKDSFNSYPCDNLSQAIAAIALSDDSYYRSIIEKVVNTRAAFSMELGKLGWTVLPSKANFIFAGRPGTSGQELYLRLKERGILVRYFDIDGIKDFVRITIGTPEDMERFLAEARDLFRLPAQEPVLTHPGHGPRHA